MSFWEASNFAGAARGRWIVRPSCERVGPGASIDTRSLRPGEVFFALRGERVDGHDFVAEAARRGASAAVVDDPSWEPGGVPPGVGVLRVDDVGEALTSLAGAYRQSLGRVRVIAVTGSNGKTTTTRLIHAALSAKLCGTCAVKSFNNALGVPITLLAAREDDDYVVCEVGTSGPGEIAALASIVRPDIAVITSVGRSHLAGLGGVEGVAREKIELARAVRPEGMALIAGDARALDQFVGGLECRVMRFGVEAEEGARTEVASSDALGVRFRVGAGEFVAPIPGRHNAGNATAAVVIARELGLDDDSIARGLLRVERPAMRFEAVGIGGVTFFNDAYNANPESVLAAIATFCDVARDVVRRVVVLGDMLELGDASRACHEEIGRAVAESPFVDLAVFVGEASRAGVEAARRVRGEASIVHVGRMDEEGARRVLALLAPGDAVLVKGSRGMGLERLIDAARAPVRVGGA